MAAALALCGVAHADACSFLPEARIKLEAAQAQQDSQLEELKQENQERERRLAQKIITPPDPDWFKKQLDQTKARREHQYYMQLVPALEKECELSKKPPLRIGMTQKQALESNWGAPQRINRTTTARTVQEQWVYGGGNYLYFTNGKLTAIQN
jgi:hypothetical protein